MKRLLKERHRPNLERNKDVVNGRFYQSNLKNWTDKRFLKAGKR